MKYFSIILIFTVLYLICRAQRTNIEHSVGYTQEVSWIDFSDNYRYIITASSDQMLRKYVSEQLAKASKGLQHPTVFKDNIYQKFGFKIKN